MSLPSSGPMSLSMIAQEFGGAPPHSLSEYYRGGPYVPNSVQNYTIPVSGIINLSMFYSASNRVQISVVISSNMMNIDLINLVGSNYTAGISDITFILNSGIVVGSASTAAYAMYVRNFTSGDTVTMVINGGYIIGCGGAGGNGSGGGSAGGAGGNGGNAIYAEFPINISNNGIIGAGGGGGGGGAYHSNPFLLVQGGGGGGGGAGYNGGNGGAGGVGSGGTGGNGSTGIVLSGGAGGVGYLLAGSGGAGGGIGQNGSGGALGSGISGVAGSGGAAGLAVYGNSYINWSNLGDVRGARIN